MPTRVIILAAGKSKRMDGSNKTLLELGGKPIIQHLLGAVKNSGVDARPVIIVGPHNEGEMRETLGPGYEYAVQKERSGTGDAVRAAESLLRGKADTVIVLYGDHPFVSAKTIRRLVEHHRQSGAALTMMTTRLPDFAGWRSVFKDFGRIVRDPSGKITGIVESKDATPDELAIKEVNPALFCLDAGWLWQNLPRLQNRNAQGEYYLTDLVGMAVQSEAPLGSIEIDPRECLGINTPEQLEVARSLV